MHPKHTPPKYQTTAFHCPFCNVYANQNWYEFKQVFSGRMYFNEFSAATCVHCAKSSMWCGQLMVHPDFIGVQPPNQDLSHDVQIDYQEAASIFQKSPRGAAALLRLAIQKLCKDLGEKGKNINADIGSLVAKGLPSTVQKSLDVVRVIGNDAVHPGQIDLRDNIESAGALFRLINIIAEKMLTEPKEIEEIYNSLPETKRQEIQKRDSQ